MIDADRFRIEAALHFGFEAIDGEDEPGQTGYFCTELELIAFAKACERKGRAEAAELARSRASLWAGMAGGSNAASAGRNIAAALDTLNAESDAAPIFTGRPDLDKLLAAATAHFDAMTSEQQKAHMRAQAENWAASEMQFDRRPCRWPFCPCRSNGGDKPEHCEPRS